MEQEIDWQERFVGRTMTFMAFARQGAVPGANKAQISLFDSVSETLSEEITTTASFQPLVVSRQIQAAASLGVRLYPAGSTAAQQGGTIFDWCVLVDGHYRSLPFLEYDIELDYFKISRWYTGAVNKQFAFDALGLGPYKFFVPFSNIMRGTPTVALTLDGGSSTNVASIVATQANSQGFVIEITPTAPGFVDCQFDYTADASI
jgi:hypothetical protein